MPKNFTLEHITKNNNIKVHIFRCYFLEYESIFEIYKWCQDNIKFNWTRDENIIEFGVYSPYFTDIYIIDDSDAMIFKLTWF
jgi:hypothetical protein